MKKILIAVVVLALIGTWVFIKTKKPAQTETSGELNIFAMSDYFPAEVLKSFEEKFNCRTHYDNFSSNEELLAKLQAGAEGYDIIIPSDYAMKVLIDGGLVGPLDHTKLPNIANLAPEFRRVPFDIGNKYSVAYTWGTTGIIYNSEYVNPQSESLSLLFDERYKGKIALLDDMREVFGIILKSRGYSSNTKDKGELELARQFLTQLKPSVRLFASDPKQHILAGDIWIAQIYSGDAFQITRENPKFKYFVPAEGGTIWIDNLAIPAKAQNTNLAHAFINYILDADVGAQITEKLFYASPNQAAESKISSDDLKPGKLKSKQAGNLEFLEDIGNATDMWDKMWTQAKTD